MMVVTKHQPLICSGRLCGSSQDQESLSKQTKKICTCMLLLLYIYLWMYTYNVFKMFSGKSLTKIARSGVSDVILTIK